MNAELRLDLDHINGKNGDNRLANLRWLCPNCHNQTATYKGGNIRGKKRPNGRCLTPEQVAEVHAKVGRVSLSQMGRDYGCSTETIRNVVNGKYD